ncbi:hypothetical protein H105_03844 [Trichophyton soudanense CBS 452.61]|uniref:EF-hand domain-containing protein n=1 Tax=Trichophyton soudanense CBS 452.61 TaxID=1215331 RepID=A0A022XUZ3_TRISD|nr:hypothetical protein H105_03844 [Trichophyton soudanense CBS 452.61]EZG06903.1 hypothetical protein H106_03641 [Trichophyton rubrum CBS 735.88]
MISPRSILLALLAFTPSIYAHGSHGDNQDRSNLDWATLHMMEEHHITSFDARSFFSLHDYDNSGLWTTDEVRRTYGLDDESNAALTEERKQQILREVFNIFDPLKTGVISANDYVRLTQQGKKLPDFGTGPGHHGDMEYEYEIHHFEKYHGDDTKEEDLTHPEDIEHFRKHDREYAESLRLEKLESMDIVLANIPAKFLKSPSA